VNRDDGRGPQQRSANASRHDRQRSTRALVPKRIESARALALTALRNAIQWGELAPGERISEANIAKRLGLSRTPIREASQQLASEGLLETVQRVGSFVRRIEPSEIDEIYQLKALLEPLCAKLAAQNISATDQERLRRNVSSMERHVVAGDVHRMGDAIDAFHDLVLEASGSRLLPSIYAQIDGRIRWLRRRNLSLPGRLKQSLAQHRVIARAIVAKDPVAAEAATRRHVADAHRHILAASQAKPSAAPPARAARAANA
jgi:DNA-binding GntR family transcriptional regulator